LYLYAILRFGILFKLFSKVATPIMASFLGQKVT